MFSFLQFQAMTNTANRNRYDNGYKQYKKVKTPYIRSAMFTSNCTARIIRLVCGANNLSWSWVEWSAPWSILLSFKKLVVKKHVNAWCEMNEWGNGEHNAIFFYLFEITGFCVKLSTEVAYRCWGHNYLYRITVGFFSFQHKNIILFI